MTDVQLQAIVNATALYAPLVLLIAGHVIDAIGVLQNRWKEKGGGSDAPQLGLVSVGLPAGGGEHRSNPCPYCGEISGHTGQCPVVS